MDVKTITFNLNEDLQNKRKHFAFYLYHSTGLKGLLKSEFGSLFLKEAVSEMESIRELSSLIHGIGGKTCIDLKPHPTFTKAMDAVKYAHEMLIEVVQNYETRIKMAEKMGGLESKQIVLFLEKQFSSTKSIADNWRIILEGLS